VIVLIAAAEFQERDGARLDTTGEQGALLA